MRHRTASCTAIVFVAALVANCGSNTSSPGEDDPNNSPSSDDDGADSGAQPGQDGSSPPSSGCQSDTECDGGVCSNGSCTDPTTDPPDTGAPVGCTKHEDCQTGCGDDHQCATAPSCTRMRGGRTCGPNGGDDCCARVKQGTYTLDKYLVTAGRMRAFIERFNGNIDGFVKTLSADRWDPSWNDPTTIPTDMASADVALGMAGKRSCKAGDFTGRTYWTPKADDDYSDFDQDTLDEKALNCVPWQLMQALCAFDGGHLAKLAELREAFTNGGTTKYPWGDDSYDPNGQDPKGRLNAYYIYNDTPIPPGARLSDDGSPKDIAFYVSPPGRYPLGNNQAGITDSAGNLLEWVGDQPRQFVWKADWEKHGQNAKQIRVLVGASSGQADIWLETYFLGKPWIWGNSQGIPNVFAAGESNEKNGYYSIGGRCAY